MKKSLRLSALVAAAALVGVAGAAHAGTYNENFEDGVADNATLNGTAAVNAGSLRLTENAGSQQGSLVIGDLDAGTAIQSFRATFDLAVGPTSGTPADGVSFVLAPIADNANFGEEGPNPGLVVSFDIFNNDAADDAPSIDVIVNGTRVGHVAGTPSTTGGAFVPVSVVFDADGTIDVTANNSPIHTDLATGYVPQAGDRFGFGGRTGGLTAEQRIDNINIATVPIPEPATLSLLALGGLGLLARRRRA